MPIAPMSWSNRAFNRLRQCVGRRRSPNAATRDPEEKHPPYFHRYGPLLDDHIRIITIRPGEIDKTLDILLEDVPIDNPGPYSALSYAWGDDPDQTRIQVNGSPFEITLNLNRALLRLRSPTEPVRVWVDAICINQQANVERNHQVKQMGEIYRRANLVTVWLGEEDDETEDALAALNILADRYNYDDFNVVLTDEQLERILNDDQIVALRYLFRRPWFSRLWVFQEIVLAKKIDMILGSRHTAFGVYHDCCEWLILHGITWDIEYDRVLEVGMTFEAYNSGDDKFIDERLRLSRLVNETRNRISSDPRDKIFGLLGIAIKTGGIQADYNKSARDVYVETARTLIKEDEHLCILSYAQQKSEYPSWVPDWSMWWRYFPLSRRNVSFTPRFRATYPHKPRIIEDTDEPDKLQIQGRRLDTVKTIFSRNEYLPGFKVHNFDLSLEHLRSVCLELGLEGIYEPTGQQIEDAYLRTIVADLEPSGGRGDIMFNSANWPVYMQNERLGPENVSPELKIKSEIEMRRWIKNYSGARCFFISEKGYIGLLPDDAEEGDKVILLLGGDPLYIIRPTEDSDGNLEDDFELIGECYVHGLTDGEALEGVDVEHEEFETFAFV